MLLAHLLFFKERLERFAHDQRVTGVIRFLHERIALSLTKNEPIARKNNERIPNPDYSTVFPNSLHFR